MKHGQCGACGKMLRVDGGPDGCQCRTRFGVVEGPELTPLEAVIAGHLKLCEQYQQMGEQLKYQAMAIEALRREGK